MPSQSRNMPEQERSIKSRAHEVFAKQDPETANRATKPFPVYLRETPAFPMSPTVKAMLWLAGIIVGSAVPGRGAQIKHPARAQAPRKTPSPRNNHRGHQSPAATR